MTTACFIAFIAGMIAGFISMRALGWMCVLFLVSFECQAITIHYTITYTGITGSPTAGVYATSDGRGCSTPPGASWANGSPSIGSLPNGSGTITGSGTYGMGSDTCVQFQVALGCGTRSVFFGPVADGGMVNATVDGTACTVTATGVTYSYSAYGCVTNNSGMMQGYYLHQANQDGTSQDYYSGPLGPGQYWCQGITNSQPFTVTPEQIFYNSDGGTNEMMVGSPFPAGTNSTISAGYNPNGTPPSSNPIGSGSGSGNGTNLTGNQFANGISNLINGQVQGYQLLAGQQYAGNQLLSQIETNTSGMNTNTQIDYRGYLTTLTNQGSGMLTMQAVLTNSQGGLYTQVTQVGLIAASNFALMNMIGSNGGFYQSNIIARLSNQDLTLSNGWFALTNSSGSNAAVVASLVDSNNFMSASSGQDAGMNDAGNFGSYGGSSIQTLPIYQNVNGTPQNIVLNFDSTPFWTNITPWVWRVGFFIVMTFAVGYIHSRVQEEAIRLQLVPTPGWSAGGIAAKIGGLVTMATMVAAVPLLIGSGIAYLVGLIGPVSSPFSTSGMAAAGTYQSAIQLGFKLLNDLFPWKFAVSVMLYLFLFDQVATGAVLAAQRFQKLTQ